MADLQNNAIRSLSANRTVETLAGAAKFDSEGAFSGGGIAGDVDGTGTQARFNMPTDLALDSKGRLFVADPLNNAIRIIATNGTVTTWMRDRPDGRSYFRQPTRIDIDANDNAYVLDVSDRKILRVTPQRKIVVLYEYSTEQLRDIAVDPRGTVYVTDGTRGRILKIEPR
ncbi:Serine/threonine-protein kinase PknD [compost metagenome]